MLSLFLLSAVSAADLTSLMGDGGPRVGASAQRQDQQGGSSAVVVSTPGSVPSHASTHGITDLPSFQRFVKENKLQAQARDFALSHSAVEGAKNVAIDLAVDNVRSEMAKQKEAMDAMLVAIHAAFPNGNQEFYDALAASKHTELRESFAPTMKPKLTTQQIAQLKDAAREARKAAVTAEGLIAANKAALIKLVDDYGLDMDNLNAAAVQTLKANSSSLGLDSAASSGDAVAKRAFREDQVDLFVNFLAKEKTAREAEALVPGGAVTTA